MHRGHTYSAGVGSASLPVVSPLGGFGMLFDGKQRRMTTVLAWHAVNAQEILYCQYHVQRQLGARCFWLKECRYQILPSGCAQEMTLDEYEKLREEKRANLNKPASKAATVDPKAFEGMKAYTRKVRRSTPPLQLAITRSCCALPGNPC